MAACGELEGTVQIDFFSLGLLTEIPPNGPSGPWCICAVQAFSPQAKTLAQAEFTAQPSAALLPYGCGAPLAGASAQHLDHRRVKPPTGRRNPKRRTSAESRCPSFWSEWNYRTWKSPVISMVCKPSARSFISLDPIIRKIIRHFGK